MLKELIRSIRIASTKSEIATCPNCFINPAIKYANRCHSGEHQNPDSYWMPDQVRHGEDRVLNCRLNNRPSFNQF